MWARLIGIRYLDSRVLFALAMALSVLPLWIPDFLPFVDIAQHAAQVASLRELASGNELFRDTFLVNWFTPYLGGYLVIFLVTTALPVVTAIKLVTSATVVALPVVTGLLLREIGADSRLKWLAIPAGYSFAIYWGFLVYAVAVPAALMILWLAIRFDRKPTLKNGLGVAAWSIATYFCHVVALGFGSLIALAYLLGRHWRTPQTLILRAIPYTAPVPLIALWMRRVYGTEASVEGSPIIFAPLRDRMSILFNQA